MLHRSRTPTAATPPFFTSQRRGKGQEVQVGSGIYNTDIHSASSSSGDRLSKQALVGRGLELAHHPLLSPQSLSPPTPSWSVERAESPSPDHLRVLQTLVSPAFSRSCLWLLQFELSLAPRQDGQLVLRKQSAGNSHLGSFPSLAPSSAPIRNAVQCCWPRAGAEEAEGLVGACSQSWQGAWTKPQRSLPLSSLTGRIKNGKE